VCEQLAEAEEWLKTDNDLSTVVHAHKAIEANENEKLAELPYNTITQQQVMSINVLMKFTLNYFHRSRICSE